MTNELDWLAVLYVAVGTMVIIIDTVFTGDYPKPGPWTRNDLRRGMKAMYLILVWPHYFWTAWHLSRHLEKDPPNWLNSILSTTWK